MTEAKIDLEMLRAQTEAGYVPVSEYVQAKEKADTEAMLARLRQIKAESCEKATKGDVQERDVSQSEYVILKNGYFYRPKSAGYTDSIFEAGRYTFENAQAVVDSVAGVTLCKASEFASTLEPPPLTAPTAPDAGLVEKWRVVRYGSEPDKGSHIVKGEREFIGTASAHGVAHSIVDAHNHALTSMVARLAECEQDRKEWREEAKYQTNAAAITSSSLNAMREIAEAAQARVAVLEGSLREIELLHFGDNTFHDDAVKAHLIARAALTPEGT